MGSKWGIPSRNLGNVSKTYIKCPNYKLPFVRKLTLNAKTRLEIARPYYPLALAASIWFCEIKALSSQKEH
jgi:hypothetical protein